MPTYDFQCTECYHKGEIFPPMSAPALQKCQKCEKQTYCKQISASNFQLKGTGLKAVVKKSIHFY